jgi:hypothetical protein
MTRTFNCASLGGWSGAVDADAKTAAGPRRGRAASGLRTRSLETHTRGRHSAGDWSAIIVTHTPGEGNRLSPAPKSAVGKSACPTVPFPLSADCISGAPAESVQPWKLARTPVACCQRRECSRRKHRRCSSLAGEGHRVDVGDRAALLAARLLNRVTCPPRWWRRQPWRCCPRVLQSTAVCQRT